MSWTAHMRCDVCGDVEQMPVDDISDPKKRAHECGGELLVVDTWRETP